MQVSLLAIKSRALPLMLVPVIMLACSSTQGSLDLQVEQITFGPKHTLFGYIGQSQTIPWDKSGRFILALRTDFHDRLPGDNDPAEVVLIDADNEYSVEVMDESRGWNHQQGTMFYWNPEVAETQFFFNDRDAATGEVFTVLYDIESRKRVKEYRFEGSPVGNSGVAQGGGQFLALNYARMARLRPVTGYKDATDWTVGMFAPEDDGVHLVDSRTGQKRLVVSFKTLADALRKSHPDIDEISLFINHTLWNRDDNRIWFFVRGGWGGQPGIERSRRINVPFTIKPDGTGLTQHTHIGGHPEWGDGVRIFGVQDGKQILYDVDEKQIIDQLGNRDIFPKAEGDISYAPDGSLFVNGHREGGENFYTVYRLSDGKWTRSEGLSCGGHTRGDLRIDAAPRWNRTSTALLVPGWTDGGTRQLHILHVPQNIQQ